MLKNIQLLHKVHSAILIFRGDTIKKTKKIEYFEQEAKESNTEVSFEVENLKEVNWFFINDYILAPFIKEFNAYIREYETLNKVTFLSDLSSLIKKEIEQFENWTFYNIIKVQNDYEVVLKYFDYVFIIKLKAKRVSVFCKSQEAQF